jgi:hypothetical protein
MPAIQPSDLTGGVCVSIRLAENENGIDWEVVYIDADGKPLPMVGWLRLDTKGDPWMVDQADATNGWGPLLYDVAIEIATLKSSGLRPHFRNVSDEAYIVWKHFFHNRQDVTHILLAQAEPFEHDESKRPELRYVYRKDATQVKKLKELGKLASTLPGSL